MKEEGERERKKAEGCKEDRMPREKKEGKTNETSVQSDHRLTIHPGSADCQVRPVLGHLTTGSVCKIRSSRGSSFSAAIRYSSELTNQPKVNPY